MEATPQMSEEEVFYQTAKEAIVQKVHDKVDSLSKSNQPIDLPKIEKKAENDFFEELSQQMDQSVEYFSSFFDVLQNDKKQIFLKLLNPENPAKDLESEIKACKTFKEMRELSPASVLTADDFAELYDQGTKWFDEQHFDKAFLYFLFLTSCKSDNFEYWLGKAMCEQSLGKYKDALASYSKVAELNPDFGLTYLQMIECLLLLNQKEDAKELYSLFFQDIKPAEYAKDAYFASKLEAVKSSLNS